MRHSALTVLSLVAVLVTACSSETPATSEDDNELAKGEILGGSISDAMLPLESVTSQSPPLAAQPVTAGDPATSADGDEAEGDADMAAEPPVEAEPAVGPEGEDEA